jgi:very-short-patch-repair endonuclease
MRSQRAKPDLEERLVRLARSQDGILGRSQLIEAGLGPSGVDHRVAARRLHVLWRGIYALGRREISRRGWLRAAVMACGPGAALSHRSAAELWSLAPRAKGPIHVTVQTSAGRRQRPGITIHRSALPAEETVRLDGILVTNVARTLVDVAETEPRRRVERMIDEAQFRGRFQRDAVAAAIERNPGRTGARVLTQILAAHIPGSTRTRSGVEERFLGLCRRHGLPDPEVNADVEGFLVDFVWRDARVVVETDSRAAHEKSSAFEADRVRDVELNTAGYVVLRFTEDQLFERGGWVMDHVSRALASRTR